MAFQISHIKHQKALLINNKWCYAKEKRNNSNSGKSWLLVISFKRVKTINSVLLLMLTVPASFK